MVEGLESKPTELPKPPTDKQDSKSVVKALFTGNSQRLYTANEVRQLTYDSFIREWETNQAATALTRTNLYRARHEERFATLLLNDAVCIVLGMSLAFMLWTQLQDSTVAEIGFLGTLVLKSSWAPIAISLWIFAAWLTDIYDVAIIGFKRVLAQRIMVLMGVSAIVVSFAFFLSPNWIPRTFLFLFIGITGPLVVVARTCIYTWSDRRPRPHRIFLLGSTDAQQQLNEVFDVVFRLQYQLVARSDEATLAQIHFETNGKGLPWLVNHLDVDEIVVSSEINDSEVFRSLVDCQSSGIRIASMPEIYRKLSRRIPVEHVDPAWVIRAMQDRVLFSRMQLFGKRTVDLTGAILAMPIYLLLLPFVAIAIKLDSKGPVFYSQKRSGRGGVPFMIAKFRTMRQDAEISGKAQWSTDNDPRITRVGNFLRKTRIDELPQIMNVIRGEMSLVGPRPERPEFDEQLDKQLPHYFIRKLVKPGITGWAQVHYKYGNSVEDSLIKLQYDAYYVRYWSIFLDLYTIARTVSVVLWGAGK